MSRIVVGSCRPLPQPLSRWPVFVSNADGTLLGSTVCDFYFEFNRLAGGETGWWELRDAGVLTLPNRHWAA